VAESWQGSRVRRKRELMRRRTRANESTQVHPMCYCHQSISTIQCLEDQWHDLPCTCYQVARIESTSSRDSDEFLKSGGTWYSVPTLVEEIDLERVILNEWFEMTRYTQFNQLEVSNLIKHFRR
jgi:hypothetical protein